MNTTGRTIALVSNTSWSIYNFRLGLIRQLMAVGYRVVVISPEDKFSDLLAAEGCEYHHISIDAKGTNPVTDYLLYRQFKKVYARIRPDFIFHYTIKPNIYGSFAAASLGIPSVAIVTGVGYTFLKKNLVSFVARVLYKLAAGKASEVWFINKDDSSQFNELGITQARKTRILPGEGIDVKLFDRNMPYPANPDNRLVFILTARLLWDKGVGVYAEAARIVKAQYPHTRFWLLGFLDAQNPSAIKKDQVEAWHKEGIIEFLGSTNDVKSYLEQVDCYVLPSYYREGVPRSLLEAASMQIPIITTDNVGCREVVDHGVNGYLCEVRSVQSLVAAIKDTMNLGAAARASFGVMGRKKAEREFEEKIVVKHYLDKLAGHFN